MRKIYTVFSNKTGVVLFILFSILCMAGLKNSRIDIFRTGTNTATSLHIIRDSYKVSLLQYTHPASALIAPGQEMGNILSIKFSDAGSVVFFGVVELRTIRVNVITVQEPFYLKQEAFEHII